MRDISTRDTVLDLRGARAAGGRRLVARLMITCALVLGAARAFADVPAPAAPETKAPSAIPVAKIPDALERDQAELAKIEARSAARADLDAVQQPLLDLMADVDARQDEDLAELERVRTTRALDVVASGWAQRRTQLTEIEQTLSTTSSALARDLGDLIDLRGRWEATRKAVAETGGSDILLGRVNDMLARID